MTQHHAAHFLVYLSPHIQGNQSHLLSTTTALAERVPGHARFSAASRIGHGAREPLLTGAAVGWYSAGDFGDTASNIGNQSPSFHLSTADPPELRAIYCTPLPLFLFFFFFLLMRPLKRRSRLPPAINKDLTAFLKVRGKSQPRT